MSKNRRQAFILQLIETRPVATQQELVDALQEAGFDVAQATVSRDLRALGLVKRQGEDGKSYYHLDEDEGLEGLVGDRWSKVYREAVILVETAGNLVVVKTLPGMANGAAAFVDRLPEPGLVGTIAGDDTIFVATKSPDAAESLRERLESLR